MAEAFPLDWPLGYKRTQYRQRSRFSDKSLEKIQLFLRAEMDRLGAQRYVISSNIPLRRDGGMYSEYLSKKMEDPGIAVYFKYKGQDVVVCCDQYEYPWENMYALAKGIEAIRGMSRWGVSEFMERAFTGFKALPAELSFNWWETLGISKDASLEDIKAAYRNLTKVHHPDAGGSADMFNRISKAYQQAISK